MKNSQDFELFEREFKRYQRLFGLRGYRVYFNHKPLDTDVMANIRVDQEAVAANVCLNSKVPKRGNEGWADIRRHAKHECIHLLIGRLVKYGQSRYISGDDIEEAGEELVNRLEGLIPDLPEE